MTDFSTEHLLSILEDGEPTFLLIGRDPQAPSVIRKWVRLREAKGIITAERAGAVLDIANAMEAGRAINRKAVLP